MCVCDWVTLLYSRKFTEHCKPEKKKTVKKKRNSQKKKEEKTYI